MTETTETLADVVAERDRLRRGGAELGKTLKFWLDLAVDVTNSHDLIDEDGDGDWQVVAERLAEMKHTDATIVALVTALERKHKKKPLPTIPIGTRVRVRDSGAGGVGTVVGRDGYGFDGVLVIFDEPAPRGFEDGCCAGSERCEVLTYPPTQRLSRSEVPR